MWAFAPCMVGLWTDGRFPPQADLDEAPGARGTAMGVG